MFIFTGRTETWWLTWKQREESLRLPAPSLFLPEGALQMVQPVSCWGGPGEGGLPDPDHRPQEGAEPAGQPDSSLIEAQSSQELGM